MPGSILIWETSPSAGEEQSLSTLDPEMLEQLRALGYAK
jgi:hypothetical protein